MVTSKSGPGLLPNPLTRRRNDKRQGAPVLPHLSHPLNGDLLAGKTSNACAEYNRQAFLQTTSPCLIYRRPLLCFCHGQEVSGASGAGAVCGVAESFNFPESRFYILQLGAEIVILTSVDQLDLFAS